MIVKFIKKNIFFFNLKIVKILMKNTTKIYNIGSRRFIYSSSHFWDVHVHLENDDDDYRREI